LRISVSQVGWRASFCGQRLPFTQFCQSFSVALGSPLRRDKGAFDFPEFVAAYAKV
jgi:hypothetical protein